MKSPQEKVLLGALQDTFAAASQFAQLQTDSGFRTMLSLMLPHLRLDAQAIKLQYNAGALPTAGGLLDLLPLGWQRR